jgi:hypothetical protein
LDAPLQRELQFVSLRTAAAVTYIRLVGASPNARDVLRMQRTLNQLARALAALAPIHGYEAASGKMTLIQGPELQAARFVRGAARIVMPDGKEETNLVIQRRDLEAAIDTLKTTSLQGALRAAHGRRAGE